MADSDESRCSGTTNKKRKRGPYLSYLVDPLLNTVPRSTLKSWSQVQPGLLTQTYSETSETASCSTSLDQNTCEESGLHLETEFTYDNVPSDNTDSFYSDDFYSPDCTTPQIPDEIPEQDVVDIQEFNVDYTNSPFDNFMDDHSDDEFESAFDEEHDVPTSDLEKNTDGDGKKASEPLYTGCSLTLGMSMLLIITFAMRHQLTGAALSDLLTLINLHLLSPNCFSKSLSTLHKFFSILKNPIEFHYYCNFCYDYIGLKKSEQCKNKHCLCDLKKKENLGYFIVIPLESQLQALLSSEYIIFCHVT